MSKKKTNVNKKYSIKKLSLGVASVSVGMVVANAVDLDTMVNPKTGEITEVKGTVLKSFNNLIILKNFSSTL